MASQVPPLKNTAYTFYVSLVSQADTDIFQVNPTIADGDFRIAIDDGAPANLTTVTVDADFTRRVKITLTAAQMNGDIITIIGSDAAGDEWMDLFVEIHTASVLIDDIPTAAEIAAALNDLTAAEVWAYASRTLTQSAASVTAVVTGSNISVARGTTWVIALENIGALTNYDTVYFTVKSEEGQADSAALLKVYNNASGLLVFNGDDPELATNGVIVIDDAATGDITITILEAETEGAPLGTYFYDIKGIDDNGQVDLISSGGRFTVTADITRAIVSP